MDKFCPMYFTNSNERLAGSRCIKEKCAWWVVYMKGTDQEWSECVMCALSHLYDMPTGG